MRLRRDERWRFAWAWFVGATLVTLLGCPVPGPRPPAPPEPTPPPAAHEPVCSSPELVTGCWHQPPGEDWQYIPTPVPVPTPQPTPPVTGLDCDGLPGAETGLVTTVHGQLVNEVLREITGCPVGTDCVLGDRTQQSFLREVVGHLRARGLCAGQHEPGATDEIAVSGDQRGVREGYHVFAGDDSNGPLPSGGVTRKVVWSPGAARPSYTAPAGSPTPLPTPPPATEECPVAPCPIRTWTRETLPPGWGDNEIGRPAYEVKAIRHTMGNADASVVVIRQEPYCAATGQSPSADGQPRAACPMRLPGSGKDAEQVAIERWILFGGFTRDGRNGQDCTPNGTDNPAAFLMGTGNCRMCSASLALRDDPRSCSDWF